jgi:hypothetical protein
MLLPMMGFIAGCTVFGVIGLPIVLVLRTRRPMVHALPAFVAGAMISAALTGWLYGRTFADSQGLLGSRLSILGLFATLSVGGTLGGLAAVTLLGRVFPPNTPLQRTVKLPPFGRSPDRR